MQIAKGNYLIDNKGSFLSVEVVGVGEPILIAPVPWGINSLKWKFFEKLSKNYTIIFVEPRGVGNSSIPINKKDFSIDVLVDDLNAVQNYFEIAKLFLFGSSAGGFTAMKYVLKFQDRVKKVIVNCSSPTGSFHRGTIRDRNHPRYSEITETADIFRKNFSTENFKKYMMQVYQMDAQSLEAKKEISEAFARSGISIDRYKYFATVELNKYNLLDKLEEIIIPTLVVGAKYDLHVLPEHSEIIHKLIPNSTLEIMQNSGHFPFVDEEEKFYNLITNFLN